MEFVGKSKALSSDGLASAAASLSMKAQEIWAVLSVETLGCGFLANRRPQILYERHVFHRLTQGHFDDGIISCSSPGGYGRFGAPQYDRLALAIEKDRIAALKSASWGIGQVMGECFSEAGFPDVETMIGHMAESEDAQLASVVSLLKAKRLDLSLRAHDWSSFARGYNGPDYIKNNYDQRLQSQFQKFSFGGLPDLQLRAGQLYLSYLGYNPGPVDGITGRLTRAAICDFQGKSDLPATGELDDATFTRLTEQALA